jgi:hypothetical protein
MPAPDVIVDFVFEDGLFFLAITNIGPEPAERVHVAFDTPFKGLGVQSQLRTSLSSGTSNSSRPRTAFVLFSIPPPLTSCARSPKASLFTFFRGPHALRAK